MSADPTSTALVASSPLLPELTKTGLSIVMVYTTHYTSTKLYNLVCVPSGIAGYFFGFLTTASPWCKLLLELMKLTENQYSSVILVVFSRILLKAMGV